MKIWWPNCDLKAKRDSKDSHTNMTPTRILMWHLFVWEVWQEDKISTSWGRLMFARWKPCKGFEECQAETLQHLRRKAATQEWNTGAKEKQNYVYIASGFKCSESA